MQGMLAARLGLNPRLISTLLDLKMETENLIFRIPLVIMELKTAACSSKRRRKNHMEVLFGCIFVSISTFLTVGSCDAGKQIHL